MLSDGYAKYQHNNLMTASPAKLLLAAYDGAIRFCRIGKEKMREDKPDEQCTNLNKAVAVVCELLNTLNEEVEPVLVARLKSLYMYVIEKLAHANLNQDEGALDEAIKILSQLRETWAEADKLVQQTQAPREEAA
jgi:flagellar secretion chaperone FliS